MAVVWLKSGDGEKPFVELLAKFASEFRERPLRPKRVCLSHKLLDKQIPSRGIAAIWLVQPGFRGEPAFGDECSRGLINLGDRSKKPAAKSSTMKGAKALGSKF